MRAHLLEEHAESLAETEPACGACPSPKHHELLTRLATATGYGHDNLRAMALQCRTVRDFRRRVDRLAKKRGKTIDWNG